MTLYEKVEPGHESQAIIARYPHGVSLRWPWPFYRREYSLNEDVFYIGPHHLRVGFTRSQNCIYPTATILGFKVIIWWIPAEGASPTKAAYYREPLDNYRKPLGRKAE